MRKTLRKFVLHANPAHLPKEEYLTPIEKRIRNVKSIWNNEHADDIGIEKLLRLILAFSQFIFPGLYLKHFIADKNKHRRDLVVDFWVLLKTIFPIAGVYWGWYEQGWFLGLLIWFMAETILYLPMVIFASDLLSKTSSHKRSMLLLFLNYLEINFGFATLFFIFQGFNLPLITWLDAVYFSFITAGTIGYGDLHPTKSFTKILVIFQTLIFFSFFVIFINYILRGETRNS